MCDVKSRQGFTLMELLVVLLIIGILSTVALRTIDATRDRSLFDQTTAEMNKLVQAIVGNPDLAYDGKRVDFGFVGDMEYLPPELRDLLYNTTGSSLWRGPYVKLMEAGDTVSYLYDGWGQDYTYNHNQGQINSEGGGKYTMTVKIADDTMQLRDNVITGSFLDVDDNPPGVASTSYQVILYYNNPSAHSMLISPYLYAFVNPTAGGSYEIALHPSDPLAHGWDVPIGIKKLVACIPGGTLPRYVTIAPRSHVVADFKFTRSFGGGLKMVGDPDVGPDGKSFLIRVTNTRTEDDTVSWLSFLSTSAALYLREDFRIENDHDGYPNVVPGKGQGDTIKFTSLPIPPDGLVELWFKGFYPTAAGGGPGDTSMVVNNNTFKFRFSDGSQITVKP